MGGLGHMAVKLAAAMGAEVTVLSRTLGKQEDGKRLGATHYFATQDEATFTDAPRRFDLIINTVSADLPMDAYMALLRPLGALVNVGLPTKPYQIAPSRSSAAAARSPARNIGGIAQTQEMLDFCAEHDIGATIEIDRAPTRSTRPTTASSARDVRYRFVIDTATIRA